MITGRIVLRANGPIKPIFLLEDAEQGFHVGTHGRWDLATDRTPYVIRLPSRDKEIDVFTELQDDPSLDRFYEALSVLDSEYEGDVQQVKYKKMLDSLDMPHNFCAVLHNKGTHGSFGFVTRGVPIHFFGVQDDTHTSIFWSTYNIIPYLRNKYLFRFRFFRFPVLTESAAFVATQQTCARWWKLTKQFPNDPLRCFNALELKIFR